MVPQEAKDSATMDKVLGVVDLTQLRLDMTLHWLGVGAAPLMSPRQDETSEPLLYAGWMAGPYRCKDATRGRNDDPVTSGIKSRSDRGGPKQNRSKTRYDTTLVGSWGRSLDESDANKPESEVNVSPSNSAQSRKQDDKTKKEAKRKSHVESFTRYRDLSVKFEDCSDNSSNEVNAASTIVPTVGKNSFNSTNTFSAAGPSNVVASPTYGKSSFVDASQLSDDPDMPELEDIIYSDDDNDEELLQFKMQKVWVLVDLPYGKKAIGFEDPNHPDKVYKVVKELYGLHQAPRAWYETLSKYLLENGFQRDKIDQTLFIKKQKGDILMVQIYVDDIIFGATNKDLCKSFEKLMKDKFQMSLMGELTFFLGLQVKQKKDGIFISQNKYVAKILRKFILTKGKSASTPIDTEKPLLKDPDVKRIFRYLKGKPYLGLWYPKDSPFDLVAHSDSDYAGASLDRNSTTGGCQFLGCKFISWQCKKQIVVATSFTEAEYVAAASCCVQVLWI
uniref:Putative ribonuclease H-like domain-containing protein n=1 Tax=Tanacetum cinerariifolium TaxID=118510 RepID=A0A6L2NEP9_TANCI|nr:putative ribonuclease H-like domain-containing protein [Tanacetum cinerariifolium]